MRISKVVERLEEIKADEGDIDVILSSDEEGNSHRDLYGIQVDWYHEEGGWDGDGGPVHPDDVGEEYPQEECSRAVVLW